MHVVRLGPACVCARACVGDVLDWPGFGPAGSHDPCRRALSCSRTTRLRPSPIRDACSVSQQTSQEVRVMLCLSFAKTYEVLANDRMLIIEEASLGLPGLI
jgi:hypothetical protein